MLNSNSISFAQHKVPENEMDEKERRAAFVTAMTTEHFVLQSASSNSTAEASSRSSVYVMALSSALVAMGFCADSPKTLVPLLLGVIPAILLLGAFTVFRLIDISIENGNAQAGIARIREFYRTFSPPGSQFDQQFGRWPENVDQPAMRAGVLLASLTTIASMIACINSFVAGAGVTLVLMHFAGMSMEAAICFGVAVMAVCIVVFYRCQKWRIELMQAASKSPSSWERT